MNENQCSHQGMKECKDQCCYFCFGVKECTKRCQMIPQSCGKVVNIHRAVDNKRIVNK